MIRENHKSFTPRKFPAIRYIARLVASAQCFVCGIKAVVTFKPCGHAVICAGCAEGVKICPTCKVLYMYVPWPVLH